MILTGKQIKKEVLHGNIKIDPFCDELINPNSYNFRIADKLFIYDYDVYIDLVDIPKVKSITFKKEGIILRPNILYLGCTFEKMGSNLYVPFIEGRSSTGRLGLFVHITAPLGDIGFFGQWTLQLRATVPIKIYPLQRIGQIMFFQPYGEIELYKGKYQNSLGPQWSQIFKDF